MKRVILFRNINIMKEQYAIIINNNRMDGRVVKATGLRKHMIFLVICWSNLHGFEPHSMHFITSFESNKYHLFDDIYFKIK